LQFIIIFYNDDEAMNDHNDALTVNTTDDEDDDMDIEDDDNADSATIISSVSWYTQVVATIATFIGNIPKNRNPPLVTQRMLWDEYVLRFSTHPTFIRRHLRMRIKSFYKLLEYIREGLEVDVAKASSRGGAILPEICLFCTLRWLAGGSYLDIFALTGVSVASFYRVVYRCLRLIIACKELDLKLPRTEEECVEVANGFRSISFNEAIMNCIGAIDGYLLRINTPSKKEAGNVKSYYSGHKQSHGINIQAMCDHHSRFLFFSVAAPGSVNDREAVKESGLLEKLEQLPKEFIVIGDAAYEPSERLVPMFFGIKKQQEDCDAFNFYASQCRIRIEMAFGLMQMKWGILWRPMRVKLDNVKYIVLALARLHNYVINERILDGDTPEEVGTGTNRVYNQSDVETQNDEARNNHLKGLSIIRDTMVERIVDLKLKRPKNNIIANNND
jgi:DDE superfamily endonuclease